MSMTSINTPLFQVKNISYSYSGSQPAVAGVNFEIYPYESVVILGANGTGKSTLLKLLSALINRSSGTLYAFNKELNEQALHNPAFLSEFRQRVGFVFQNSDAQLFSANVFDELAFAPLQSGLHPDDVQRRVHEIASLLEITHLLDRPPYKLSGGEKKKVAIGCVLTVNPEVILLDEPTNGLDPRTQYWLVDFLIALNKSGKTIITATHDLDIVEDIAKRVIIMGEDHNIAADGPPQKVLANRALLLSVNLIHERSHFHLGGARFHG